MEGSCSNSSSIEEIRKEYPYSSHISTPSLSVKLSDRGKYNVWKSQMIYFLKGHDMFGFINGEFVSPKGDALVVSWILGALSEEVTMYVVERLTSKKPNVDFTAKDLWDELECIYAPEIGSSSMVENREEYPYPSHISAPSLSVKLSDRGKYNLWKTQMIYFLTGHGMLDFINRKFVSPNGNDKAMMEVMEAWKRSDALVVSWILGTLSEEVSMSVVNRLISMNPNVDFTAKEVWDHLERIYDPKILQQAIGESEIITEEDAKSEDKSKDIEETNEEERETLWEYRVKQMFIKKMGLLLDEEVFITEEREKIKRKEKRKEAAYKKLYEGIVKRKMDWVNDVLDKEEVSVIDKIFNNGNTALHVAVGTSKDLEFFEEMLKKTRQNINLTGLKNSDGSTLLHMAVNVGNIKAAEILMETYPDMLIEKDKEGQTPLVVGLSNMHSKVYWDFLELIKNNPSIIVDKEKLFTDKLLELAISIENFYLARNFIWWECRKLESDAVLMAIAQNFPSELSFWERRAAVLPFLVRERYTNRHEAFQVLLSVCKFIQVFISSKCHKDYYTNPVLEATRLNALDVVKVLVYHFPDAFWSASKEGHNIIQYAVINRSEKIYNLLYHMSEHKNVYKTIKDTSGNNLLHLAARLAPSEKLNRISGAALQIQYELQWYQEVARFVCPLNITEKNSSNETPQMVFSKTHKRLVSDGEKWMKTTAESYTITATLITTVVFAAAITVPGGNNQDTGVPIFTNNPAFTIFAVSDAISLFTGVMSLLMFLSILTARFAEEDFLYKLPRKLIIGLVTLFISTTTMIIAFGAALFIVFGQNNGSLLIPIGALTGLTITFFVALQFPLVVDLMRATYFRNMFGRRKATFKKCLQNYIHKMTRQPIVEDNKEEREVSMEIDWDFTHVKSFCAADIPFNI